MISQEEIKSFLEGNDNEQYIVAVEFDYVTDAIYKVIEDPVKGKAIKKDTFTPFAWVGDLRGLNFYSSSKDLQKEAMKKHGILIDKLRTTNEDGTINERLDRGLKFMVKSMKGYRSLIQFFREGGVDPWGEKTKDKVLILPPVEQYLIAREKRLFKGFEEYNDITRFGFDLETTALEPKDGRIFMIGIKTNKGYKKVIECANEDQERKGLVEFFNIIDEIKPSIIGGYNSANFDWFWIFERCKALNLDIKKIAKSLNPSRPIGQKESMLKLANEVERFSQTQLWGYNIIDIIHSVRRAQAINSSIKSAGLKYITQYIKAEAPDRVYINHLDIGPMYAKKEEYWLNVENGKYKKADNPAFDNLDKRFPGKYIKVTGDNIVERYLDDDLEETLTVDDEFNQGTFLLASMVPTTYERVSTMGTATLWKMIMLAWSYKHKLAIPEKEQKTEFVGGLSRLLKVGYSKDVLKLDFSSLYPSIQLVHDVFPTCDVMGGMKSMLTYFRNARIMYKNLALEYKSIDTKKSLSYDRKQLPIKIFINSLFGGLSAPQVFHWGDMYMGEQITTTGRQYLRQMIYFFMKRGYVPTVLDTDGVNFTLPPEGVEHRKYIGKGNNWLVKEGKEYTGYDADVAEYNDMFMKGAMGLDCDGTWDSCINLARKNYATMESNGKIKLTGNTIKSKKLPLYIEDFLDKGVKMLLEGKGQDFIEWYYEYLTKIHNKEIPLMKIAQRAKVKLSVDDYKKRCTQKTKGGALMSRMAHMELAIKHNLKVSLGDVIYYVNNGERASHGDVQKVNKPKKGWSEKQIEMFYTNNENSVEKSNFLKKNGWEQSWGDDNWVRSDATNKEANTGIDTDSAYRLALADKTDTLIQLNCYMLDPSEIENNTDMTGDYNVVRAITTFNKRIEPLLVVFKQEVREQLLVVNPEDRGFFTKDQSELINGVPFEEGDQDSIDDLLTLSEGELKYWEKRGINPNYIYDLAEPGWEQHIDLVKK
jgi:DNA polymerase elongation subunit (family B)